MNNYYTLIYLNRELKEKITGCFFDFAISPHRDVLEIYLSDDESTRYRLIFSANPNETALFLDRYRPPKKSNVTDFFPTLQGSRITGVRLAEKDRLMYLDFEDESSDAATIQFKLFSNSPNAYLLEEDEKASNDEQAGNVITDAFKSPESHKGQAAPEPHAPQPEQEVSPDAKPKNQLTRLNPLLPRNLIPYLVEEHQVDEMDVQQVKTFCEEITEALRNDPSPRVLKTGDVCLWSEKWLSSVPTDRHCDTVNEAVRHAYRNAVHLRRLDNKKQSLRQLLERVSSKKEAQLEQLENADKSLERADEYEKYGHLLMANAHKSVDYGTEKLEVNDYYEEDRQLEIPLKEGLSIPENAQHYYEKAKSARKSYQQAKRRIPRVREEARTAKELLTELKEIDHLPELEKWIKEHSETLENFGYGTGDEEQATSPFRKFRIGKYEVWIGKNAKSNDQLTSHAHKEDIWLHARGVGGSHTVIRMGNTKEYPPKEVLLKAASYAAWYSKAKGMKTAPVMYTKRKYVRKPSGAAPGAVVVERENVEMVPPMKPQNS